MHVCRSTACTACMCVCMCAAHHVLHRMHHYKKITLWLYDQIMASSLPLPLPLHLSIYLFSLNLLPSNRVWTSTVKQTAACTVGERKRLQKEREREKKRVLGSKKKSSSKHQTELAVALGESGFGFVHI